MRNSPTALRVLKAALNAAEDGQAGIQVTMLAWELCWCSRLFTYHTAAIV